jgi:hypothetical protein
MDSKLLHSNELPQQPGFTLHAWHTNCFLPTVDTAPISKATRILLGSPSIMKQALRNTAGRQELVSKDFTDLGTAVAALPNEYRAQLEPLLERVVENSARRRQILSLVQDALGQLRLDMKYLMFDLEATRRERDEYRRKLTEEQ